MGQGQPPGQNLWNAELQVLVAIAEEGTLQKAAARLRRPTSVVSHAIRYLEEEVGMPLIERFNRHEW
jgi:DNA-binding transcriptional LysR family regulator